MARGPRNLFRISADGIGLTQFGGVALIEQFFQRIGLQGALWRHVRFAQRNNRYSISESLKARLDPLILGLGGIETTEPLRHNGVFHYLAGLPGYPDATSLRRFLQRLARAGRNGLLKLHDSWRAAMRRRPARAILDLDSTVLTVYGRQERAAVGYNPKKRGRRSYLPLLCFEGRTQDCWEGSYLVTNLALTPLHLWRFYNQRARAKLIIRELKDAYALGKIPTQDLPANEVFFQIVLLAYNLLNWFKRLCAPTHLQRATLQRLRQRLFLVPSQLVRPGGVPTLRIAPSYAHEADFFATRRRSHRLRPRLRAR